MDEPLLELENELKRLRPRAPSANLFAKIEAELSQGESARAPFRAPTETGPLFPRWLNWRTTAAAAATLVFAAILITARRPAHRDREAPALQPSYAAADLPETTQTYSPDSEPTALTPAAIDNRYHPIGAASVLYDLREDGAVSRPNDAPVHRLRYRYVDTYTWKNPATHASLKWSLPRDEVRVLPVSLH